MTASSSRIEPRPDEPSLLAFYLPQYHPIPENDEWWGPGFTEWRNVVRGRSLYPDQHQPNIPSEFGFYDLRVPEVRDAQAAMAEAYGIRGFCYYHYWFNGRRILEMPFNEVLRTGRPDFPFCLCWANEPWTRNWDGGSRELLIAQRYSPEDDREHARWLVEAFRDERYIRVGDRPVFFIYNVLALPNPAATMEVWREECVAAGVGDPFLVQFETFGNVSQPLANGCDASAEFLPHQVADNLTAQGRWQLEDTTGRHNTIFAYDDLAEGQLSVPLPDWTRYQCVVPNWDNTARKPDAHANLFLGSTPEKYGSWLARAIDKGARARHEFVLLNAWNEWAEGAYLEPDLHYGRAYLEATAQAAEVDPSRPRPGTTDQERLNAITADAFSGDAAMRRLYEDLKRSSAREISELLDQVQELEDALAANHQASDAELRAHVARLERRLSVRTADSLGRIPIAGRAIRAAGILRRDWRAL